MNKRSGKIVAVTGMGILTGLGQGKEENWRRITNGDSAVKSITRFPTEGLTTRFAACVVLDDDDLPCCERAYRMGLIATDEAMQQSGLDPAECANAQIFFAEAPNEMEWNARLSARRQASSLSDVFTQVSKSSADLKHTLYRGRLVTAMSDKFAARYGIGRPSVTVHTACASGASAIQLAVDSIRYGENRVALAIGTDSSIWAEGLVRFSLLAALSTKNDDPAKACRPFTIDRDGFVMGEGAGTLVFEDAEHARARGAQILGYVLGYGDATDSFHRTRSHPSGEPIVASMRRAIDDAGLPPEAIQYINAHGTSTPENDKMESLGIEQLFNSRAETIPVSSNKSMIGHTLAACGTVEAVLTLLTMQRQVIPPTINHDKPDPTIHLDVVPNVARPGAVEVALSNSFGFGGQNVSLVFAHADADAVRSS